MGYLYELFKLIQASLCCRKKRIQNCSSPLLLCTWLDITLILMRIAASVYVVLENMKRQQVRFHVHIDISYISTYRSRTDYSYHYEII